MFDTKIAIVVRSELETWKKLNVTAFLSSGIASSHPVIGLPYEDADGNAYLPMPRQPILVFAADAAQIKPAFERASAREDVSVVIYTMELFNTFNDEDNRAAVKAVPKAGLDLAGFAVFGPKNPVDRALKGLALHP